MAQTIFQETWLHLIRSTKNRLAVVLVFAAIIFYSAFLLPRMESWDTIDVEKLHTEMLANKGLMENAAEKGNIEVNTFTGQSAFQQAKYHYEHQRDLYWTIKNGDAARYAKVISSYIPPFYSEELEETYLKNSPYPGKDRTYDSLNFYNRLQSYKEGTAPLTFSVIQEKTSLQQLQLFFLQGGSILLVLFSLFIASDVFVSSRKARTQRIGIPLNWNRYLWIQSMAVLAFLFLFFLSAGIFFFLINGLLHGFGSLDWKVPFFEYSEDYVTDTNVYQLMTIGSFLLKALPFFLLLIYLFTRLSVLFSLIFRQEVMVFLSGLFMLFFEQLYFSRTTRRLLGVSVSYFPQTYFDFGKVIAGEKNFLLNIGSVTAERGLLVLGLTILFTEAILAGTVYVRTRQKFIQ